MSFKGVKVLITGAAGFIGSHLAERFLKEGARVFGVDCLTSYYDVDRKRQNLARLTASDGFFFRKANVASDDLSDWIEDVALIYHLSAQPGVRHSWGPFFDAYVNDNILATQKILEAATKSRRLKKFCYASSSSIYGNVMSGSIAEDARPAPISPYGVTKLAGEHLVNTYFLNFGVPAFSARFFTVYGPRQRPDMAFQKLIESFFKKKTFVVYGNGKQQRDFTFIDDVIESLVRLSSSAIVGEAVNVSGGRVVSMEDVIGTLEQVLGHEMKIKKIATQKGDALRTHADVRKLKGLIKYEPSTRLIDGLQKQVDFTRGFLGCL